MNADNWQAERARREKLFEGLPVRARNALWNACVESKEDAARLADAQLLSIPNFGRKSLAEVRAWVAGTTPDQMDRDVRRRMILRRLERAKVELKAAHEKVAFLETQLG